MAKDKNEQTSKGVASRDSKLLSDSKRTKALKAVTASAPTQASSSRKDGSKKKNG